MRIGVIGLGRRMSHMLNCMREHAPDLSVCGVVDPDEAGSRGRLSDSDRAAAKYFNSVAEMVKQVHPDAVAIGTRCNLHARYAVDAAAYRLPLFLEKPVATTLEDAIALEEALCGRGVPVLVSFPLRATPLFAKVRDLLAAGAVGRPEHIMAWNYVPYGDVYFSEWYRDHAVTQGLFVQKATHDFDYMMQLAGAPIARVAAMRSCDRVYRDAVFSDENDPLVHYCQGIGTPASGMNEDSSSALVEFANGATGIYTQVFYARRDAAARGARVTGMEGTVMFDWYRNEIRRIRHFEEVSETIVADDGGEHFGGDGVLAKNFVAMVCNGVRSISPIEAGLESVYACLAAKESAESGRFVSVRQLPSRVEVRQAARPVALLPALRTP